MEFRPCIDLHQGKVKQIVGSSLRDGAPEAVAENFVSEYSPAHYARLYRNDGLKGGHVIMLGPGNDDAAREALQAWSGGLQVGGGINADNAAAWLEAGADGVIVTSYVFRDGLLDFERLEQLEKAVGREQLILDLSCRLRDGNYFIVTDRWQRFTDIEVNRETLLRLAGYCREYLIHAVDVEGKQAGIDEDLIAIMAEHSPIPTVYAGGIRSLADIETIRRVGREKVSFTVGSALDIFGGKLKYSDVVRSAK